MSEFNCNLTDFNGSFPMGSPAGSKLRGVCIVRGVFILTCCLYRPMVLQKQQGKQVNRAGLSEIFGVALPTVDQWARNGCPVVKRGGRGREWTFDTAVVARWLRDKAAEEAAGGAVADIEEWKRRKIAAEAQREELHLADAKSRLLLWSRWKRHWPAYSRKCVPTYALFQGGPSPYYWVKPTSADTNAYCCKKSIRP